MLMNVFNTHLLLRDDFHIGLVISPMVAVFAWGEAECQYSNPRISNFGRLWSIHCASRLNRHVDNGIPDNCQLERLINKRDITV
jgi:hypothetical protein